MVTSAAGAAQGSRRASAGDRDRGRRRGGISGAGVVAAVTAALGPGLLLCEGGPSLFGRLLADHAVHELFLTISPRVAGRDHDQPRPGIVDGWAAAPDRAAQGDDRVGAAVRRSPVPALPLRSLTCGSGGPRRPGDPRPADRSHRRRDERTSSNSGLLRRKRVAASMITAFCGMRLSSPDPATGACRQSSVFSDGDSLPASSRYSLRRASRRMVCASAMWAASPVRLTCQVAASNWKA